MIFSWVEYSSRFTAGCVCDGHSCIECHGAKATLSPLPARESFADSRESGDYTFKTIQGIYRNGVLVSARSTFTVKNRALTIPSRTLNNMMQWGVMDCNGRKKPVISSSVYTTFTGSTLFEQENVLPGDCYDFPHLKSDITSAENESVTTTRDSTVTAKPRTVPLRPAEASRCRRIAPASSLSILCASNDDLEQTSKEQRKIRNRESAFRASAKRSELRRQARIVKQSAARAQAKTNTSSG